MRFDRTLIGVLLIWILALAPSAFAISISVSGDVGGFTQNINAGEKDAVYSSTIIAANSMSHSIKGSGSFRESHRVSNTAGANAKVGVDIRQAEWYSYSYDLWPGEGSSWPASKFAQVAASEQLDVLNARYIQAYANAHNSKGYTAGVSTVISDPGREASLTGYRNLAMASKDEAMASQTADGAFAMDGFIQADSGADFIHLKSRPLQFRWDTADASTRVDSGSVEGYSDLASASAYGVAASQQMDAATGEQIRTRSESASWTASLFQGLKTANAKVSTRAEGDIIGYNASAGSSEGYAEADQAGHIIGTFTSTALAGKASKTRASNYGTEYDFYMQAKKNASGSYATGTLDYYVDNVSPVANRIQGAVDASESGDAINIAPGTYYENVQIDKSLNVIGAGAYDTIVDGNRSGSVFTVGKNNPNSSVKLSDMTIQDGSGTSTFFHIPGYNYLTGGGIWNAGNLKLDRISISENNAYTGGGIFNEGVATITGSTITGNKADYRGGGIDNIGTATVEGSTISENFASIGGGLYNGGTTTVTDDIISGNNASYRGGGIANDGKATVIHGTISENTATFSGGGIYNGGTATVAGTTVFGNIADWSRGGGIANDGIVTVTDSIISKNGAGFYGGGIENSHIAEVTGSTISENMAEFGGGIYNDFYGTVTIANSSIFRNIGRYGGGGITNLGTATIANDTISKNTASIGGGIYIETNVNTTVIGSTISENNAVYGGGINNYGVMTITRSNISGNNAIEDGGGIFNYGKAMISGSSISWNKAGDGGGIYNPGTVTVADSNITKNLAYLRGGGIYNDQGYYDADAVANLESGSIDHNTANLNGGGIYNDQGFVIGNISIVHDNTPDQIAPDVDWLPMI